MKRQTGAVEEVLGVVFGDDPVRSTFNNFILGVVDEVFDFGKEFVDSGDRLSCSMGKGGGVFQNEIQLFEDQAEFMKNMEDLDGGEGH